MSSSIARWFGPEHRPLFGWVHVPDGETCRGAVVLCPPLAREHTSVHYTYRTLAEALADAGLLVVRFDYDGTGDSSGSDADAGRVEAWLSSIGHAVGLATACGAAEVSIVGMRMGALLAAAWTARHGGTRALVLWDPCTSGQAFVKEQTVLQRLRSDAPAPAGQTGAELPGFVFLADTVGDLASLELAPAGAGAERVLVLTRAERAGVTPLAETPGSSPIEHRPAHGQEQLLDVEPLFHQIPTATVGEISAWLAVVHDAPAAAVTLTPACRATWAGPDGVAVTEELLALGPLGLFGVATTSAATGSGPTVLFLNSGNDWHVGPNRLWVELSRRWAAAGMRCVRFDESGLGDSPVHPGQTAHMIWAPEAFDDVAAAAGAVSPADPTNVVLAGLCSGAYQALENALWLAPRGVLAVNPVLRFDPPEMSGGRIDPRRQICRPTNTLVTSYRNLAFPALRRRLRSVAWRVANTVSPHRSPKSWLAQLVADGVDTYCICGEDEARPLTEGTQLARLVESAESCLRVEVVPGLDHALMAADQRALVCDHLTEHLLARFGPARAPGQASATMPAQLSIG
jgi:alpha-beta hydrolase superfamily lysophospholipase